LTCAVMVLTTDSARVNTGLRGLHGFLRCHHGQKSIGSRSYHLKLRLLHRCFRLGACRTGKLHVCAAQPEVEWFPGDQSPHRATPHRTEVV